MSEEKQKYETALTKVNNIYFPMIQSQLENNSIEMDDYAKQCVMNSISAINNTLDSAGVSWGDKQLDQSNVTEILLSVASLKLNPTASPNEIYFQVRNVKFKKRDDKGRLVDDWRKQIEMGIEGDGNDAILSRFGRNVKQVMQFWLVRSGDDFQYPSYNGLEMQSPQWTPKGKGDVIRVVYPIIKHGDLVEFHIAERDDVIRNLLAHINNNLMNETFGIAKSRYDATPKQREQISEKKNEILERAEELGLDGTLKDKEMQKHISPAWKDLQSRESMIIRKMRNNIVKKIPKDFGNTLVESSYDLTTNDFQNQANRKEINEQANSEIIDIESDTEESKEEQPINHPEPEKEPEERKEKEESELKGKKADHIIIDEYATKEKDEQPSENKGNTKDMEPINISVDDIPF